MKAPLFIAAAVQVLTLAQPVAAQPDDLDRAYIGRQIARDTIIDYRLQPDPGPDDARAGAMLLELAAEFRPDDPILLRYLVEAYRAAGDEEALIDATKRLVRVDPGDEVSQLRLISWSISRKQTVEERLAAYAEWLDGRGAEYLSDAPAVASRLALDAALLHRETGDEEAFIGRLAQATRLDSSNKEAAALAAAVFAQRSDDPVARLELAINLLLADPVDPNLHLSIAQQLASFGVYDQARRFYNNADRLYRLSGANVNTMNMVNALVSLDWYAYGPDALLETFEVRLRTNRAAAQRRIDQLIELGQPTQDETTPEDIRLDLERERFRLYAAVAVGDRVAVERSIADMEATTQPVLEQLSDRLSSTDQSDTQQRVALVSQGLQFGVATIVSRLVADFDTRTAENNINILDETWGELLGRQLDLLRAAAKLRNGDLQEATAELEVYAQETAAGAYFFAIALERAGRTDEAIQQFQRAADSAPLVAIGALASAQAQRLRGGPAPEAVQTEAIRATAAAVPVWVDRVTRGPASFMRLNAYVDTPILRATDETVMTIELRNLLPRPVAVGGDRPIGTRMAISPRIDVASHLIRGRVNPEVVDAHRKLRLEPGQAARIDVWPDAGMVGLLTELKAGHRVRSRFSVLQNFVVNNGPFQRGPFSLAAESELITRVPMAEAIIPPADLIRYVQTADEPALLELLPACRAALADVDFPAGQLSARDADLLARALAQRYPRLSRGLRAAVIAVVPPAGVRTEMTVLDQIVIRDDDPALQRLAFATRATDAQLAELVAASQAEDAAHAWFAAHLINRLSGPSQGGFAFLQAPPSHLPEAPGDEADR